MTDYKRMVSYMYQYENGEKKKNIGFARVETRDGQCKITLHMQLIGQLDSIFPTYLIRRDNKSMDLIYVGDAVLKNQVMDSKLTVNAANIMDSGHSLSEVGGLLLFLKDSVFFATEWDDRPVEAEKVLAALRPRNKQQVWAPEEDFSRPRYRLPGGYKTVERLQGAASSLSGGGSVFGQAVKTLTHGTDNRERQEAVLTAGAEGLPSETQKAEAWTQEVDAVQTEETGRRPEEKEEEAEPGIVAKIFEKHPRIYPFEDNEILLCAKIEPEDLGLFPKELWALSSNSFLVHGYYCYHHLIFAKMKDRYGSRYILGVPGIYHNRERFMAKMFGFENFKSIRKRELRQGDFGYWYVPVAL
ncbi:hypothetical protein HNQ56_002833 [Anaerotaenia torta]|uniref:DUF6128 domain-containing protein n=1 Tax=Anaerotaenia torta TaxID=433293 RepID=UPI003D1FBF70